MSDRFFIFLQTLYETDVECDTNSCSTMYCVADSYNKLAE